MNTAMDDGRQESPGEQTLSFHPVRDDDGDTFDAFAAGGAKAAARRDDSRAPAARRGDDERVPGGAEEAGSSGGASDEGSGEPVDFFKPRKPVTEPGRTAATDAAGATSTTGTPQPDAAPDRAGPDRAGPDPLAALGIRPLPEISGPSGGPSLFVKPAALGGPATTDEAVPDEAIPEPEKATQDTASPTDDEPDNDWLFEEPHAADEAQAAEEPSAAGEEPSQEKGAAQAKPVSRPEPGDEAEPAGGSESGEATEDESRDESTGAAGETSDEAVTDEARAAEDASAAGEAGQAAEAEEASGAGEAGQAAEAEEAGEAAEREAGGAAEAGDGRTRTEALPAEAVEALTAALGNLRESVADLRLGLDFPGADEARRAQADLLAQLEDYVLPRVRTSTAPALIVVAGSTGAGKSTLVNSLAERNVSRTGVRRPTTGTPVLVCHPDDRRWFAEGELLGNLERLEKAAPAAKSGVVLTATEKLPQGVALLDTPDIDSVVEEHHEVAHRMLDVADLWIFVTTAARYADAPAWNLLKLAKERGARLAIVLSRVQPKAADVVMKHFVRMLTEYGLGEIDRFVIHESKVVDGRLPDSEMTDLRLWLAELSVDEERRAQAVRETLSGVLDSFRVRVPALAKHLEAQVAFRAELRSDVDAAFFGALSAIDKASKNGSLLHGEALARWQDFVGSGDLMRSLRVGRRGRTAGQTPERVVAFKAAIRTGLESVIVAAANRAAEEVVARWRHRSELGARLGEGLDRPSDDLVRHTARAIASWQEHLSELVRTEGVAKRSVSKLVSFDPDALALIFMVAMFSGDGEGVPHRLVNALLGAESLRGIGAKALSDLRARIGMLFDEEAMRYVQALDSAGIPDESVATRLYQATYNLEVAR